MNQSSFWEIIDTAWQANAELMSFRNAVLETIDAPVKRVDFEARYTRNPQIPSEAFLIETISNNLNGLSKDDLRQFDLILEQKLFDLDREDIHEHTDGSDDGFLYCRGFIVVVGQEYYDSVMREPANAMLDWGCEAITYLPWHLYKSKFGAMPSSQISRETGSNSVMWS
ncbi:MAG: DUF4240 domain-containing protein [Cyanobacteria bacterium P01_H01_bin.121]